MNRKIVGALLCAGLALTACGNSESASTAESEVAQQEDTESAAEETSEQPRDDIDPENVGTYIGADGSYLTLLDDGTADYYYPAYDDIRHGNEWSCVNGTLFVTLDDMESKISADIPANGDEYTFVEISGSWDDERFKKVTLDSTAPTIEEYEELRAEAVPMQDKEQMNGFNAATNQTCVVGDMQFEIPSYWTSFETDVEESANYYILDGDPYTVMFIERVQDGGTLVNSSAVDCAYYVKSTVNVDGMTWLSASESVSDLVATATGTSVFPTAEKDYNIEFCIAFRINQGTEDVYLVQVYQPLDSEKGYFDDAVRIAESGTAVQGSADTASTQNTTDPAVTAGSDSAGGLDPEFKEAMDSYEAFFDKYAEFMNTYRDSDNTVEMIAQYAQFLAQYTETMDKLDAIDESQLTPEEDAYYIEVMNRINTKLAQTVQ